MFTIATPSLVTLDGRDYEYGTFYCLSSDDKRKSGIFNGSIVQEIDTGDRYKFDMENQQYLLLPAGEGGESIEIEPLIITENGTYEASEGTAYSPISVSVPQTTVEELNITSNGTYTPSEGHAYAPINVSVPMVGLESMARAVGVQAFVSNSIIQSVYYPECLTIYNNAFSNCSNLSLISFPKCKTLSNGAFSSCTNLEYADFPLVLSLGSNVFYGCRNLKYGNFETCSQIGYSAFYNCYALLSVNFENCKLISNYAFGFNSALRQLSFPMCTSIYGGAFMRCYSLESIYLLGSSVPILSTGTAFESTPIVSSSYLGKFGSIIVQPSMLDAFKSATNWSLYSSRFSAWNGVD